LAARPGGGLVELKGRVWHRVKDSGLVEAFLGWRTMHWWVSRWLRRLARRARMRVAEVVAETKAMMRVLNRANYRRRRRESNLRNFASSTSTHYQPV